MNERWDTSSAAHETWMFPLECGSQASSHQSQELDHIFSLGVHDVAKKKVVSVHLIVTMVGRFFTAVSHLISNLIITV